MSRRPDRPSDPHDARVLAALDTIKDAQGVLEVALSVGRMTAAGVEAVHVGGGAEELDTLVGAAGVPIRRAGGQAAHTLLRTLEAPEVLALVIGAGLTPAGGHPVGTTARRVLERAVKPVVVVPDHAVASATVRRILVPLEGTETSSRPVLDALCPLLAGDVELVVLHVFTERTVPRMLDRPVRDLELLGREFLATHFPTAARIDLRHGPVAARVAEASVAHGADMVALSWSQISSEGKARVVREVLAASSLPVLLLPASPRHRTRRAAHSEAAFSVSLPSRRTSSTDREDREAGDERPYPFAGAPA